MGVLIQRQGRVTRFVTMQMGVGERVGIGAFNSAGLVNSHIR